VSEKAHLPLVDLFDEAHIGLNLHYFVIVFVGKI